MPDTILPLHPLEPGSGPSSGGSRSSARFFQRLSAPTRRSTPLGTDTAWALKLKDAVDCAERELNVQVLSAQPICSYEPSEPNDMMFELKTDKGTLQAIRSRQGRHTFNWT
jgi:hypothetical protein